MYRILTQILGDKDRNGKDHNRVYGPDKKGHFKIGFSDRIKAAFQIFSRSELKESGLEPNFTRQSRPLPLRYCTLKRNLFQCFYQ